MAIRTLARQEGVIHDSYLDNERDIQDVVGTIAHPGSGQHSKRAGSPLESGRSGKKIREHQVRDKCTI